MALTHEQQLSIISKAWGKQTGYCFFPYISGDAKDRQERIKSYHEGQAFYWPKDKARILEHMGAHTADDLYWCPSLFESKRRVLEQAMDEHALWADLDAVDPRGIEDFPPTVAWETSPGRYQALWIVTGGDVQGASWHGGENHRLTHYLGADPSGWDTTQLLRIPGWRNHKPEYVAEYGEPPEGKLLWRTGRRYLPDDFEDLPEVAARDTGVQDILEDQIDAVDRMAVWGKVRLKVPQRARELVAAREASGDRSDQLWWLMRCLADEGCTVVEIVAIVRETVWNKFSGRNDELKRLITEASKAISQRAPEKTKQIEEEREGRPEPVDFFTAIDSAPSPKWIIRGIWTQGSVGFIAGQPKSYKSWIGMDLAMSVASGAQFLNHFDVEEPGPVLYVQEEDSLSRLKDRKNKVWPSKQTDRIIKSEEGVMWIPANEGMARPAIMASVRQGFVIPDPGWQSWLDEQLENGHPNGEKYTMVVLDPLMMMTGEIEENKASAMTEQIFKPLKVVAEKHKVAIAVVHHMRKGGEDSRGGQRMLGSVANHAWAEDSMYVSHARGDLLIEVESKTAPGGTFKITNIRNRRWDPIITDNKLGEDDAVDPPADQSSMGTRYGRSRSSGKAKSNGHAGRPTRAEQALKELGPGPHTTAIIAEHLGIQPNSAYRQLTRLLDKGTASKEGGKWQLIHSAS